MGQSASSWTGQDGPGKSQDSMAVLFRPSVSLFRVPEYEIQGPADTMTSEPTGD